MSGFSRHYEDGKLLGVMCPICFNMYEPISAREGGMLSTEDNGKTITDVCVDCRAKEWLQFAYRMGA